MSPTRLKARHICSVVKISFSTSSSANLVRQAALCAFSRSSSAIMRISAILTMPSLQQKGKQASHSQPPQLWQMLQCGAVDSCAAHGCMLTAMLSCMQQIPTACSTLACEQTKVPGMGILVRSCIVNILLVHNLLGPSE